MDNQQLRDAFVTIHPFSSYENHGLVKFSSPLFAREIPATSKGVPTFFIFLGMRAFFSPSTRRMTYLTAC
jgi:hypothetical protein